MVKALQTLNVNLDAEFKEGRMEVMLHGKKEKINESLEKLKKLQRGIKKGCKRWRLKFWKKKRTAACSG
ncbi:MAG: hypothetical protein QXG38_00215 [Candidatus Hadarchaeales archaeon]